MRSLLLLTTLATSLPISAAILRVDLDISGGSGDGSSWANAYSDLQTAIDAAVSGDRIWVAEGTYPTSGTSFQLKSSVAIYGGFTGSETALAQRNPLANETVLKRNGVSTFHVLEASSVNANGRLDGFTITDGAGLYQSSPNNEGGGLRCFASDLTISNCHFISNDSDYGGAAYLEDSSPTFSNCTFSLNSARFSGGAIYARNSTPTFDDCHFEGNLASDGGAAYLLAGSDSSFMKCTFQENAVVSITQPADLNEGGAIYCKDSDLDLGQCTFLRNVNELGGALNFSNGTLTISKNQFIGNQATSGLAGAVQVSQAVNCSITNSLFRENTQSSLSSGGGAVSLSSGDTQLTNCAFLGNSSNQHGGAIRMASLAVSTLTNCLFTGNHADEGGAIHSESLSTTIVNCSFTSNTAGTGGAILGKNGALFSLTNTVIWNNFSDSLTTTQDSSLVLQDSSSTSAFYSLIEHYSASDFLNQQALLDGTDSGNAPLFTSNPHSGDGDWLSLDDNHYGDLTLQKNSPLIDQGNSSLNTISTDLVGKNRVIDSDKDGTASIEIGALETKRAFYVDQQATGSNNGNSWKDAYETLAGAINASSAGDELWVRSGTYLPTSGSNRSETFALKDGVCLYGGFNGKENNRPERNATIYPTILSGEIGNSSNSDNSYHVLTASGISDTTTIDGFTIIAGNATSAPAPTNVGGAFAILNSSSPQISNCRFHANEADMGGALAVLGGSAPTLTNCSFVGNFARLGGAAHLSGSSAQFLNCSLVANEASSFGGALHVNNSTLTIWNTLIMNNLQKGDDSEPGSSFSGTGNQLTVNYSFIQNIDLNPFGSGNLTNAPTIELNPSSGDNSWSTLSDNSYGSLALKPSSSGINEGSPGETLLKNSLGLDLADQNRISGDIIDIGVFENIFSTEIKLISCETSSNAGTVTTILTFESDAPVAVWHTDSLTAPFSLLSSNAISPATLSSNDSKGFYQLRTSN